jgi:GPH family glycoside/pentoside/hexuronide:cation symporter
MAALTMNLPDLMVMQWLLVRYVSPNGVHLVPKTLFGFIFLCGRITDGLSCSLIAHWSDACRSRWGRRLPFMRLGLAPFALVFFLLFSPPVDYEHWLNAIHAFILIQCYFILYGIVVTPYLALMPEITPDLKERVDLATSQSVFMVIGTVLFTMAGQVLKQWGWTVLAGAVTVLIILFYLPVAIRIRENPSSAPPGQEPFSYFKSLGLAFRNRPCRFVLASTALYWFGLNGMIALVPYWTVNVLGRGENDVTMLMIPFVAVNVVFFFVFNALATRLGKYVMMLVTLLGSALVMMAMCLVGHLPFGSDFIQTALVIGLFGAPVAGFMVLPFAMLADVIDYDERLTGRRREAIFFGVQGIFQKLMLGMSMLTFTIVPYLGGTGAPTVYGLKLMAFLCGLASLAAFAVFIGYPLRERHGRIVVRGTE